MSKRKRTPQHGKGEEIMAFRARARKPSTRPARTGRNNRKAKAILEGSR